MEIHNLFTGLSTGLLLIVAALAWVNAERAKKRADFAVEYLENKVPDLVAKAPAGLQTALHQLETQVAELDERQAMTHQSHKRLLARVGMRENREKKRNAGDNGEPDAERDPEGWKRWVNAGNLPASIRHLAGKEQS